MQWLYSDEDDDNEEDENAKENDKDNKTVPDNDSNNYPSENPESTKRTGPFKV